VYKLPRLSRDEVKEMLGDILNVQLKQTRFYQDVFAEGRQEGEVMMLLRLLEQRFGVVPDSIRSRLKQADMDTLLVWSERVLTCTTLDEVLDK
jgi:predicted transposase YdaD